VYEVKVLAFDDIFAARTIVAIHSGFSEFAEAEGTAQVRHVLLVYHLYHSPLDCIKATRVV
jgi:hypothetical protein